jgi:hypothetical protein
MITGFTWYLYYLKEGVNELVAPSKPSDLAALGLPLGSSLSLICLFLKD